MNIQSEVFHVNYLILGQGLCGTLLTHRLMQAGKSFVVIDNDRPLTASKVASGVINPVTGRRIVRTWRIEELLPFAWNTYQELEKELNTRLVTQCNILDFYNSHQMQEAFENRLPDEPEYLGRPEAPDYWRRFFHFLFGIGEVHPCLLVDMQELLTRWRQVLQQKKQLVQDEFTWAECVIGKHEVRYKNIVAEKVICCEGVAGFDNPYFKNLPYSRMKGEALIVSIPGLPRTNIYKQGINIVPWRNDLFWIGSTYEWDFTDLSITPAWRKRVEEQLSYWLRLPFKVVDHIASERPANMERRPFVGLHPTEPRVGIFNGMGAKGCSVAPLFAKQLTDHLVHGTPIYPDADVVRFAKSLARTMN